MDERELSRTGVRIPEVGLGTWMYQGGPDVLRQGIEAGAAFIDTAEYYGNEEVVGKAIQGLREKVFVATKTHHWKHSEVMVAAETSLRQLGIDSIDLYQLHWPNASAPIGETMGAMEQLVEEGKVRHIGVSNFTVRELVDAGAALSKHRIVANQVRYSLADRTIETELLPYCREHGVTVIAYSPLSGTFSALLKADPADALGAVALDTGKTRAQVALNWCLRWPEVVVIPKTDSIEHAIEDCGASGWSLSEDQAAFLGGAIACRRRGKLEIASRALVRRSIQRARGH